MCRADGIQSERSRSDSAESHSTEAILCVVEVLPLCGNLLASLCNMIIELLEAAGLLLRATAIGQFLKPLATSGASCSATCSWHPPRLP